MSETEKTKPQTNTTKQKTPVVHGKPQKQSAPKPSKGFGGTNMVRRSGRGR